MRLTPFAIEVLKNFSTINQSIQFKKGYMISTISPLKTIIGRAKLDEEVPSDFCIYDLGRFLGAVSLYKEPVVELGGKSMVIHEKGEKTKKLTYSYASPDMIILPPEKELNIGDAFVTIALSEDQLVKIMQARSVLRLEEIAVVGDGESVWVKAIDSKNATADTFGMQVMCNSVPEQPFKAIFKAENLMLIKGSYEVTISAKRIAHFKNVGPDIQYWVAVEQHSTFGE